MLTKIKALATKPSTYVLLAIGGVIVLAFAPLRRVFAPIAAKVPGAS
jgi:hypothetical protein